MKASKYNNFDDLPLFLNAEMAAALGKAEDAARYRAMAASGPCGNSMA